MRAAMERASESLDDQTVSTAPAMLRRLWLQDERDLLKQNVRLRRKRGSRDQF